MTRPNQRRPAGGRPAPRATRRIRQLGGALLAVVALAAGSALGSPGAARAESLLKPVKPLLPPVLSSVDLLGRLGGQSVPAGPTGPAGGHVESVATCGSGISRLLQGTPAGCSRPRPILDALKAVTNLLPRQAASSPTDTLILYDTTGPYGWLGEAYATMTANLSSQFGTWTAKPISTYVAGDVDRYRATLYLGSTYDEPIPTAFLDEVVATTKPVVWMYSNIWQLTNRHATFRDTYGWMWSGYDFSPVNGVAYKGVDLTRDPGQGAGIMNYAVVDPGVEVLATARRTDGTTLPWALRSRNLTYIGELPYPFFSESDRLLAFEDLLFDALDPGRPERHRALVRIEDINPTTNPASLRAIADYLASTQVPFSFGVSPKYRDPLGAQNNGVPETVALAQRPGLVSALRYMQSKGGVMIEHGWTHQYSNVPNPYDGVTGDDTEFYRVVEQPDHTLSWTGPVPEDSPSWVNSRINGATVDFTLALMGKPSIFEFPHYAGSANSYREVGDSFPTRYERSLYFNGILTGTTPDHSRMTGQLFPYVVIDVYGTKVLPESLGNVEPEDWHQYKARLPEQIIADAHRNLVVRDGFASFYFHPFLDLDYLRTTVEGIQAAGYTFVSPTVL